jgi:sugar-specific transcriptional regulator TrmB
VVLTDDFRGSRMSEDTTGTTHADAVERLQKLGLTEYAAQVYVALLRLGSGTAREIAETVNVPRTRVYDAVASLQERGFVDVSYSSPKLFRPISQETATRQFQLEYDETIDDLTDTLAALEPIHSRHEQTGVWTVSGREAITDRVLEFIAEATTEVVYMSVEELLTDDIIEALATADGRGAAVQLAGVSSATREEIQSEIPNAETFETLWEWSDTTAGRLLMVDRETILVSVLSEEGTPEETAVWGSGTHNSLVVVLKAVFTWRINHADRFEDDR